MREDLPADPSADLSADARDLRSDVAALAAALTDLAERYDNLTGQYQRVDAQVYRTVGRLKRWAVGLALSLVLDIGLTGWLLHTNDRVSANQARIDTVQARTSAEVLCPLYRLFVDSYDPKVRDARPPEKRADYEAAHAVLRAGYEALGCPPRPSPSPSPSK